MQNKGIRCTSIEGLLPPLPKGVLKKLFEPNFFLGAWRFFEVLRRISVRQLVSKIYPRSLIVFPKGQRGKSVIIKYEKHSCITRSFIIFFLLQILLIHLNKKDEMLGGGGGVVRSLRELRNVNNFIIMAKHRHKIKWDLGVYIGILLKRNLKEITTKSVECIDKNHDRIH
jgi:hypothetical protein